MASFLTTNGTSYQIEHIITHAEQTLTLVSPYLQISKTFLERLKDAAAHKVKIQIVFGKDELKPNERNSLAQISNLELYYFENLHAKCYFNEKAMVLTSMNMYEFSEKNNREMGVFISSAEDSELYKAAVREARSIIQHSESIELFKTKRKLNTSSDSQNNKSKKPKRGYCIRCEDRIPYNIDKPYCIDCFNSWSRYANRDYEETACHSCGEFEFTTMDKPICYPCYKKYEA
ncbi:phospholipase D-like domain-containing protein [Phaeocystidibacter luteus]|uniref:Phospholipase D-like domain-containing protein n=1 Tax=Phaeocystidibacter luteus TaxID=911197 RepID=A0A6N6RFV9_9FLAO|nr:phospholipase D-like domain-containing protein [Phaeocystidibacter luteus]KAB2810021.1 hypothetical protein F8C67_09070 [Phaeocystidibacter luteus]